MVTILKKIQLNHNDDLYTVDINDMYNNINHCELMIIIGKLINRNKYNYEILMKLIRFDIQDINYFVINDNIYKQSNGVPMGASTSSIYAEIYLDFKLNSIITYLKSIGVKKLIKYADDYFIVCNEKLISEVKYTMEQVFNIGTKMTEPINKTITFLDVEIIYKNCEIRTKWFKKKTVSNRLINYHSYQELFVKKCVIRNRIINAIKKNGSGVSFGHILQHHR